MTFLKHSRTLFALALLGVLGACKDTVTDPHDDHMEDIVAVEIADMSNQQIARYEDGVWTLAKGGSAVHMHPGDELAVKIFFIDDHGDKIQLPPSGQEYSLRVKIADTAVLDYDGHSDHGHFEAKAAGETTAVIQLYHGNHADWETNPGLAFEVVDHHDHHDH